MGSCPHAAGAAPASREEPPHSDGGAPGHCVTPGPAGLTSLQGVDPLEFLGDLADRYGDALRYRTRIGYCYLFLNPEHVQTILHRETYRRASLIKLTLGDGLLASDGPRWRSQRRLMQPNFFATTVAPFASIISRESARTAGHWRAAAESGQIVDVTSAMTRLTLRIIVEALFSEDLSESLSTHLCSSITQTLVELGNLSWTVFGASVQVTPGGMANFTAGKKAVDEICYELIARRRQLPPQRRPQDLLTLLIEAETDGAPMTDLQLRDEIITMLVGGHETTALALAWTWKSLAEHPDAAQNLRQELDQVLGDAPPSLADVSRLPYTKAVFQETLRLNPPVWNMSRVAEADHVIHGHAVPRGACVMVSQWLTHRHKALWPDPLRFDPTRFTDPARQPAHRYAYFPFGGGRHHCLGIHLAMMEGSMILADLARQFIVKPTNADQVKRELGITLRQSPSLAARIEQRRPAAAASPIVLESTATEAL